MASEKFANDLGSGTTLTASMGNNPATDVTASVAAVTGVMPTSPQFRIRIGTELMLVTAVSSLNLTVTRAIEGSTIATHSGGENVYHVLTAASVPNASLPWSAWPASPGYTVPVLADFTAVNFGGSATATQLDNSVTLTDPSAASDHLRMLKITSGYPTPSFTLTVYMQVNAPLENFHPCGLYWGDGTKIVTATIRPDDGTAKVVKAFVDKWDNATTFHPGGTGNYVAVTLTSPDWWQQITDDGANRIYRISRDGLNWQQVHTIGRTDFLTPSECGIVWEAGGAPTHSFSASWLSFKQT